MAASVAGPAEAEFGDAGLDFMEVDIAQLTRRNDVHIIYHAVADGARRQVIDRIGFGCLEDRPCRGRLVDFTCLGTWVFG